MRRRLMATQGGAPTVDWRLPAIHGIFVLWRRNQSTDLATATCGNSLRRRHLTWVHRAVRMAGDDAPGVKRIDALRNDLHQLAPSRYATFDGKSEVIMYPYRIFLSYCSEDKAYAKGLVDALSDRRLVVFWDHMLTPGNPFTPEIKTKISRSQQGAPPGAAPGRVE